MRLRSAVGILVAMGGVALAADAGATSPAEPRCHVDGIGYPAVRVPANAPVIPLAEQSYGGGQVTSLQIAPLDGIIFTVGAAVPTMANPERYLPVRPSGLLPLGKHTLSWTLSCSPYGTSQSGERRIEVLPATELPSGSLGSLEVLPAGHAARIKLSPANAAYAHLSTFVIRYEGRDARPNAAPPRSFGFGGSTGDTLEVGFLAPGDAAGGDVDLRQQLVYARPDGAGFCKSDDGVEDFEMVVEQHVAGASGPPSTVRGTLRVDCAHAASLDSDGIDCAVGRAPGRSGRESGGALFAALGGLAAMAVARLRRARRA